MAITVEVSRARCIASKSCMNAAPGVFELDPTRVAVVKDPDADPLDAVIEAAECCPTGAITVYQDGEKLA